MWAESDRHMAAPDSGWCLLGRRVGEEVEGRAVISQTLCGHPC